MNNEVVKLSEENHKLKKELEELRLRVATSRPQDNKVFLRIIQQQIHLQII